MSAAWADTKVMIMSDDLSFFRSYRLGWPSLLPGAMVMMSRSKLWPGTMSAFMVLLNSGSVRMSVAFIIIQGSMTTWPPHGAVIVSWDQVVARPIQIRKSCFVT